MELRLGKRARGDAEMSTRKPTTLFPSRAEILDLRLRIVSMPAAADRRVPPWQQGLRSEIVTAGPTPAGSPERLH
jgi:hypothetical protein